MNPKIPTGIDDSPGGRILRRLGWLLTVGAIVAGALCLYLSSDSAPAFAAGTISRFHALWSVPLGFVAALCFAAGYACDCLYASARHAIIHSQVLQRLADKHEEAIAFSDRGVPIMPLAVRVAANPNK